MPQEDHLEDTNKNMKNMKPFESFLNEWLDSPGSVDVPGQDSETRVNSRNYTPSNDNQLPYVEDAMFESSHVYEYLDSKGKSLEFDEFLKEKPRKGKDITDYLKEGLRETKKK
jgi:hypothetical protein